jgi:hypothetical protein
MNSRTNCLNVEGTLIEVGEITSKGTYRNLKIVVSVIGSKWAQELPISLNCDTKLDTVKETEIGSKVTVQIEINSFTSKQPDGSKRRSLWICGTDIHWDWMSEMTKQG